MKMEELLLQFDDLKLSPFSKLSRLSGDIHNVTLGPSANTSVAYTPEKKIEVKTTTGIQKKPEKRKSTTPPNLNLVLKQLEIQRREKVQEAVDSRFNKFREFSKTQEKHLRDQWIIQQQKVIQQMEDREKKVLQIMQQCQQKNNTNTNREKLIYQELVQKKQHYEQQLERNRQKQRILSENLEKMKKLQSEFRSEYEEIAVLIKSYDINKLKTILGTNLNMIKSLPAAMEELIAKCKQLEIDESHVAKAINVIDQIKLLKKNIHDAISKQKQEEEHALAAAAAAEQQKAQETLIESSLDRYVSPENLKRFTEIQEFASQYRNKYKQLFEDEQMKQFKFDLKKAVNIPVNAISTANAAHLRDKYVKLSALLSGQNVCVADRQINAAKHPQGIYFCTDLLARKLVLQSDLMVSGNPEAAFCYATIIITLWKQFPDFGKLILYYFYTQCPYLIPFNIPKTAGQLDQDYYQSLGYRYTNNQIEQQDKFLKRMTGIFRLYFAITIAKPKGGGASPYYIENSWNFMTSLLKIEPKLDVTATAVHTLFETIGFQMEALYGKIFKRIVHLISEKFIKELKRIDSGGPVTRLEVLLEEYKKKHRFDKPPGVLSHNFW